MPEGLNQRQLADELGFSLAAIKKWRRATIAALTRAGQQDWAEPTVRLPSNALPLPVNQPQVVTDGALPLFDLDEVVRWAKRTGRRNPVTGAPEYPTPPGRPTDSDRRRRQAMSQQAA